MRAGLIVAIDLHTFRAPVAAHDTVERPGTFGSEQDRFHPDAAVFAFGAPLRWLQLTLWRAFEILSDDFRQFLAERAEAALAHDAFAMTDPAVCFIHAGILNPCCRTRFRYGLLPSIRLLPFTVGGRYPIRRAEFLQGT